MSLKKKKLYLFRTIFLVLFSWHKNASNCIVSLVLKQYLIFYKKFLAFNQKIERKKKNQQNKTFSFESEIITHNFY